MTSSSSADAESTTSAGAGEILVPRNLTESTLRIQDLMLTSQPCAVSHEGPQEEQTQAAL